MQISPQNQNCYPKILQHIWIVSQDVLESWEEKDQGKTFKRTVHTFSSTVGDSQFFTHKNKVILILNSYNLHKNPTELYYTVYNVLHKEGVRFT